tara:strand:+ start:405 stop:1655 length:1251 start_codon:yes stop_codon:yes gene_type:complete
MIGIILFVLYNHIDSFSIGIPNYVLLYNSNGTYSIDDVGGAGDGSERRLWQGNLEEAQFNTVNGYLQQYPTRDPRNYFNFFYDEAVLEAVPEAVPESCPPLPENVADRLCKPEPEPEPCAASSLRNSLDGPGICGEPSVVGTGLNPGGGGGGGSGSRRTPCSRFLRTKAVSCFADNPQIMRSLFEEYELLSGLLALPVDQVTQIQNVPGFESLDPTMEREMLRSTRGQEFFLIFDFIRRKCQLFRFDDVLEILNGITFYDSHFRGITVLEEIKRRSRIIIYILLFLIKCNFNNDFIKRILNYVIYKYFTDEIRARAGLQKVNILNILFRAILSIKELKMLINNWCNTKDKFYEYHTENGYNMVGVESLLTYEDYTNLFNYLRDNWPSDMRNGTQGPDIISALMDPIFRNFFGLPDL